MKRTSKPSSRRSQCRRQFAREVHTVLRAAFGADVVSTTRPRPSKARRDLAARLLGYRPEDVIGVFVLTEAA